MKYQFPFLLPWFDNQDTKKLECDVAALCCSLGPSSYDYFLAILIKEELVSEIACVICMIRHGRTLHAVNIVLIWDCTYATHCSLWLLASISYFVFKNTHKTVTKVLHLSSIYASWSFLILYLSLFLFIYFVFKATAVVLYMCNLQLAIACTVGVSYAGDYLISSLGLIKYIVNHNLNNNFVFSSPHLSCFSAEVDSKTDPGG